MRVEGRAKEVLSIDNQTEGPGTDKLGRPRRRAVAQRSRTRSNQCEGGSTDPNKTVFRKWRGLQKTHWILILTNYIIHSIAKPGLSNKKWVSF